MRTCSEHGIALLGYIIPSGWAQLKVAGETGDGAGLSPIEHTETPLLDSRMYGTSSLVILVKQSSGIFRVSESRPFSKSVFSNRASLLRVLIFAQATVDTWDHIRWL